MSFDNVYTLINMENIPLTPETPHAQYSKSPSLKGKHCSDFFHDVLILSVLFFKN